MTDCIHCYIVNAAIEKFGSANIDEWKNEDFSLFMKKISQSVAEIIGAYFADFKDTEEMEHFFILFSTTTLIMSKEERQKLRDNYFSKEMSKELDRVVSEHKS